jgi:hypothetical protein
MNYNETRSKSAFPNNIKKAEFQFLDNTVLLNNNKNNISIVKHAEENSYLKMSLKNNKKGNTEKSYIGLVKEKNENVKGNFFHKFSF